MKVVIVSGGTAPSDELINKEIEDCTYLICADSGANCLYEYDICPDFIIGDFDSIEPKVFEYFKNKHSNIIQYPPEKDYTDTEIAVNKAVELGANKIILLGCTGTRIDHSLGNLGMLIKCLKLGVSAYIKDKHNVVTITNKPITLLGSRGKTFSLVAYYENVDELSISGAKYPLDKFYLEIGNPITISNEFIEEQVEINFKKGTLLVIYPTE
ncbi:thiamine diphosphokinase [Clostridium aestuarii]|uniref:Thiamine diphosphokinase n=1 Tax=Clostridium aestuarii TaxID=338193 RepID=A0ABT4D0W6_9CLOT|nr:thiamine diphosphokinase [Clostridium aestuarii]MCY6483995.1 thiamine diphosphokinase [Clostridium aestuarii]